MNKHTAQTQHMVLTALLAAIIILMANVPYLGYINLGIISATTIHIPVIIGAILLGPGCGAFLGFVFGATSCFRATMVPSLTSFCFSPFYPGGSFFSLIVCFVPRILIGIVSYYVFAGMKHLLSRRISSSVRCDIIALPIAGIAGSLTNTLLVMNFIYLFFMNQYAESIGVAVNALYGTILGIIFGCGVPEAIVSAILTLAICKVLLRLTKTSPVSTGV